MHTVWSYLVFKSSYGHVPGVERLKHGWWLVHGMCEGVRGGDRCKGGGACRE